MNENKKAQDELADEMTKIGLTPSLPPVIDEEDEEEDKETSEKKEEESDDEDSEKSEKDEEESEEDGDDAEDADDEDSDEDDEAENKKGKYIPEYKFKRRVAKEAVEKKQLLDTISSLTERLDKFEKTKTEGKTTSKFIEKAKAAGLDEEAIKNLTIVVDSIKEDLEASSGKVTPEIQSKMESMEKKISKFEQAEAIASDIKYFNKSWNGYVPTLEKEYPDISSDEAEKVKSFVDKIWHTEKYADKEIDYVVFKNRDAIDALISPRKKGFETGRTQGISQNKGRKMTLPDNPTDKDLRDMDKLLSDEAQKDGLKAVEHSGSF